MQNTNCKTKNERQNKCPSKNKMSILLCILGKYLISQYAILFLVVLFLPVNLIALQIQLDGQNSKTSSEKSAVTVGYVDIERVFEEHPMTRRSKEEFLKETELRQKAIDEIMTGIAQSKNVIVSSGAYVQQLKIELEKIKNPPAVTISSPDINVKYEPVSSASQTILAAMLMQQQAVKSSTQAVQNEIAVSSAITTPVVNNSLTAETAKESKVRTSSATTVLIEEKEKAINNIETGIESLKNEIEKKQCEVDKFVELKKKELVMLEEENTQKIMKDIYNVLDVIAKEDGISIIVDKSQILYGQSVKDLTEKVLDRLRGR